MKRVLTALVAVGALVAFAAAPAGAQEELGLETNILEGQPGEIVSGQVDTDDIAEHCVTDLETFRSEEGPFVQGILALTDLVFEQGGVIDEPTNSEELAAVLLAVITLGVIFDAEIAEGVLAQTFVLTFADIATQEPVGEMGNFDRETGAGLVTVPDIEPGQWAVAAACVSPTSDPEAIRAALDNEITPFVDGLDFSEFGFSEPFPTIAEILNAALAGGEFTAFLEEIGPTLLEPLMVPDALGAVIFCILDENNECPTDVVPPGPDDDDDDDAEPADAVVVQPDFTG
jgi:hypothetical protein